MSYWKPDFFALNLWKFREFYISNLELRAYHKLYDNYLQNMILYYINIKYMILYDFCPTFSNILWLCIKRQISPVFLLIIVIFLTNLKLYDNNLQNMILQYIIIQLLTMYDNFINRMILSYNLIQRKFWLKKFFS